MLTIELLSKFRSTAPHVRSALRRIVQRLEFARKPTHEKTCAEVRLFQKHRTWQYKRTQESASLPRDILLVSDANSKTTGPKPYGCLSESKIEELPTHVWPVFCGDARNAVTLAPMTFRAAPQNPSKMRRTRRMHKDVRNALASLSLDREDIKGPRLLLFASVSINQICASQR